MPNKPRLNRFVVGPLVILGGIVLMIMNYNSAISEGGFFIQSSVVGPVFIILGIALLLFKPASLNGDGASFIGSDSKMNFRAISTKGWIIIGIGFALGLGYLAFLYYS